MDRIRRMNRSARPPDNLPARNKHTREILVRHAPDNYSPAGNLLTDRIILESRTGETSNFDILYSVKKK